MKILLITVGTSALTASKLYEGVGEAKAKALRSFIERYEAMREDRGGQRELESDKRLFDEFVAIHREHWKQWGPESERRTTSAELSSTSLLLANTKLLAPWEGRDRLVLLLSDTEARWLAGRVNAQILHDITCMCGCGASFNGGQPQCGRVVLHTVPKMDAEKGFEPVIGDLKRLVADLQEGDQEFSFNITGGYKGTIPSITSLARTLGCPLYYLHESQKATVRVDFPGGSNDPLEELVPEEDVV